MPPWLSCGFPSHWQIMEVMRPGEKQSPAWQEWPQNGWLNLPWMLLCDWVSMRGWACDHSLTHDWHWPCHSLLLTMLDCIYTYNSWDCCTILWIWSNRTLVYNQQLAFFFLSFYILALKDSFWWLQIVYSLVFYQCSYCSSLKP